eukprot:TRINITY_DN701_c0_g1_i2.p1 TRINITY_DN701_c0_g1~~TRINITY_DN701_c0_g1_i2.p1  ORF type:complete len:648 (+),score=142.26 TRINITY_DN701_c0_g1_i2:2602-4545(+)
MEKSLVGGIAISSLLSGVALGWVISSTVNKKPNESSVIQTPSEDRKERKESTSDKVEVEVSKSSEMKKIINNPDNVVADMLEGLILIQSGVKLIKEHNIIIRSDIEKSKKFNVSIISGGGSGHEPAHAGFVGEGMLSAAVCGDVFSSPTWSQVYAAIKACSGTDSKGVLLIVKNYTGDILHFGMAAEYARKEGIQVNMVIVKDDVALLDQIPQSKARGLAGTILVHRVAGALSKAGKSLKEVTEMARKVADAVKTMGVSLSPCTIPSVGKPSFYLGPREFSFGLGIHGEPGIHKASLDDYNAEKIVEYLLSSILKNIKESEREVIVFINNLSSTTNMELSIIASQVHKQLKSKGIEIAQLYSGTFMSSLEMAGISISILPTSVDKTICSLLSSATDVSCWPKSGGNKQNLSAPYRSQLTSAPSTPLRTNKTPKVTTTSDIGKKTVTIIKSVCESLIKNADELTNLDRKAGDGDFGVNIEVVCKFLLSEIDEYNFDNLSEGFKQLTFGLRNYGGSSGAFISTFFSRFCDSLKDCDGSKLSDWVNAYKSGIDGIMEIGGAQEGMKTMLDSMLPSLRCLQEHIDSAALEVVQNAAKVAMEGAMSTRNYISKAGRSQYVGQLSIGVEDPGAKAVAIALNTIAQQLVLLNVN